MEQTTKGQGKGGKRIPGPGKTMGPPTCMGAKTRTMKVPVTIIDTVQKYAKAHPIEKGPMPFPRALNELWANEYNPKQYVDITPIELTALRNQVVGLKTKLKETTHRVKSLEMEKTARQDEKISLQTQLDNIGLKHLEAISLLRAQTDADKKEITSLKSRNKRLKENQDVADRVGNWEKRYALLTQELGKLIAKWKKKIGTGVLGKLTGTFGKTLIQDLENLRGIKND